MSPREITKVADALELLLEDDFKAFHRHRITDHSRETTYKFPFGIFFRGQQNTQWELDPTIFRYRFDESSLYHHFLVRATSYRETHRSVLDWLSLMQNYDLPTRLLDWSESVLVALYFAAKDSRYDGRLFILNARRLNGLTSSRHWNPPSPDKREKVGRAALCTPWSTDAVARAQLTVSRTVDDWRQRMISLSDVESWRTEVCRRIGAEDDVDLEALAYPIAVLPSRLNGRMIAQSSAFTVHGGKWYPKREKGNAGFLPEPVGLKDLAEAHKTIEFLRSYNIPKKSKKGIRKELLLLGVHPGALFPEADRQAESIRYFWKQPGKPIPLPRSK